MWNQVIRRDDGIAYCNVEPLAADRNGVCRIAKQQNAGDSFIGSIGNSAQ